MSIETMVFVLHEVKACIKSKSVHADFDKLQAR